MCSEDYVVAQASSLVSVSVFLSVIHGCRVCRRKQCIRAITHPECCVSVCLVVCIQCVLTCVMRARSNTWRAHHSSWRWDVRKVCWDRVPWLRSETRRIEGRQARRCFGPARRPSLRLGPSRDLTNSTVSNECRQPKNDSVFKPNLRNKSCPRHNFPSQLWNFTGIFRPIRKIYRWEGWPRAGSKENRVLRSFSLLSASC